MAAALKNVSLQAYYSYKGLFLWLNWPAYISNVFIAPVILVIMLTLTGRFAGGSEWADSYMLGAAVYGVATIIGGGILQSFFYERAFGTLSMIYASRSNRLVSYWCKGLLHYPNGVMTVSVSLFFGWLLLDLDLSRTNWPALVLLLAIMCYSCLSFAMFLGNFSIAFRDWFIVLTVFNGILLTLTGVIVPISELPWILSKIGHVLPLTHGLFGLRESVSGTGFGEVRGDILYELVLGLYYMLAGGVLFRVLEAYAKRIGTYESAI